MTKQLMDMKVIVCCFFCFFYQILENEYLQYRQVI